MAKLSRIASLDAHRSIHHGAHDHRRRNQGDALVAQERLAVERDIRSLGKSINEYEELIARLPDDLGVKPGQHRLKFGKLSFDLVLSTKPELRELVRVLRERRAELMNGEGHRRVAAATELRAHLRGQERPEPPPKRLAIAGGSDDPPPTRPSKWG